MAQQPVITFRLTTGKKEGTYSLKGGMGKKNGIIKQINYRRGADSPFDEDNKKSDIKPSTVVFRHNDILADPAVEIIVPVANKALVDYLKTHSKFNKDYKIHDEEELISESLSKYEDIEKALEFIKDSDEMAIKAKAMAVFGFGLHNKSVGACKDMLKQKAHQNPKVIIDAFQAENYQSKYLAGIAFCNGIIENNSTNTAVVWSDNKGVIVTVAKGENGIDKVGEFFSVNTEESRIALQELGARIETAKQTAEVKPKTVVEQVIVKEDTAETIAALSEKDREIAELKALLAGQSTSKNEDSDSDVDDAPKLTLEQATAAYVKKFDKNLPFKFAKNLDWILEKLKE